MSFLFCVQFQYSFDTDIEHVEKLILFYTVLVKGGMRMEITQENKTIYSNINGQFVALVDNGYIYQLNSFTGQRMQIGVTQQTFDELKAITDGYYKKLVEAGIIKEPKTNEQIIAEQQEMMSEMMKAISKLTKKVEEMENGRNATDETI